MPYFYILSPLREAGCLLLTVYKRRYSRRSPLLLFILLPLIATKSVDPADQKTDQSVIVAELSFETLSYHISPWDKPSILWRVIYVKIIRGSFTVSSITIMFRPFGGSSLVWIWWVCLVTVKRPGQSFYYIGEIHPPKTILDDLWLSKFSLRTFLRSSYITYITGPDC